ncbi:MAG: nucleotide pyrophosphatase [Caulobacteraceae bacterium]|nr:nucleotide pyrophosphatase [Caulobacteraceae bacterium]
MRARYANAILVAVALAIGIGMATHWGRGRPHNVIIFVADGLRSGIVTPETAPALAALRAEGVDFQNSHSLYPTLTTPNASAIATGHYLGDTGDFGNSIYVGPQPLGFPVGAVVAPLEDDGVLDLMDRRYGSNYLNEESLLAAARASGFSTAAIGKLGPTSIQDVGERTGLKTIVIDDSTGQKAPDGIPLAPDVAQAIKAAGLPVAAPDRGLNGDSGAYNMPGVHVANVVQQDWFAKVATEVLLPRFKKAGRPFAMVFWSRDPDGTQHFQGDSLNQLAPGINGPTTMAAIRNASNDLQRLRDALKVLGLDKTTDIVVTADHGFSTTSKQSRTSPSTRITYRDVVPGFLPHGFLAIDLSLGLNLPLFQPNGLPVDLQGGFHPKGSAVLGADPAKPEVVVAANGGSDLIYLPGPNAKALASRIVALLTAQDYTAGIFASDAVGPIPGTLPMSLVGLQGAALTPQPDLVVGFASHAGACGKPDTCQILVADSELQQGQGNHGSFGRGDTHNFMAAVGPDFKTGFLDQTPVSNADLALTIAKALRLQLPAKGKLTGRVIGESLKNGKPVDGVAKSIRSPPAPDGFTTVLDYQEAGGARYFDAAGMPGRVLGVKP